VFAWTLAQVAMMLVIEIAVLRRLESRLFRRRRDSRGGGPMRRGKTPDIEANCALLSDAAQAGR
jgi:hypothetical protein